MIILFCIILSLTMVCQGQTTVTKSRSNSPSVAVTKPSSPALKSAPSKTVFNFTLGEPLKGINRRCEREDRIGYRDSYLHLCTIGADTVDANGFYTDGFVTINFPRGGRLFYLDKPHILATIVNGRLEELSWQTDGLGVQSEVMLTLKDKFGEPLSDDGMVAEWKFSDLEIQYYPLFIGADKGRISITTPAGKEHKQKQAEKPKTPIIKM